MYYYLYKITNKLNNKIYVGVHQTKNLDDEYMGSGIYLINSQKKHGIENFKKEILHFYDNKEDMFSSESTLVNEEFVKRKDTYNLKLGGEGGWDHLKGKVVVKDKDGNTFDVDIKDPRYLSGELVHVCKGLVTVKDKEDNYFSVSVKDSRYLSGELVHVSTGHVIVRDKEGNCFSVSVNNLKYLSGELVPYWCGKKHTEESKRKIGKANSVHQKGSGNSQYGKMWIHNLKLKESKKINKNEEIPEGWLKGRKIKW